METAPGYYLSVYTLRSSRSRNSQSDHHGNRDKRYHEKHDHKLE